MKLTLREKRIFYDELGRLLRVGRAFPQALEIMLENTRGKLRQFLRGLHRSSLQGDTVGDSFARQRPTASGMEVSILTSSERAGRLEHACAQLSAYFAALEKARAAVMKRLAYPALLLHFAIFVLAAPKLVLGGKLTDYLWQTFGFLLLLYVAVFLFLAAIKWFSRQGEKTVALDQFLRWLPPFGKVRRSFALTRFCATYEAQLMAGVNVFDALTSAADASASALIVQTVRAALPKIRDGEKVGATLQESKTFPKAMMRAFRVSEETGELDQELARLTEEFERDALARVETLTEWLPKLIYLLVVIYMAFQMIGLFQGALGNYEKVLNG